MSLFKHNQGIKLILLGLILQITPLFIFANKLDFGILISLIAIVIIIIGYIIFVRGCGIQAKLKGYSFLFGVGLGLLSIVGISVLVLLHPKRNSPLLDSVYSSDNPLQNINLLRWLLAFLSSIILSYLGFLIFLKILGIDNALEKMKDESTLYFIYGCLISILIFFYWMFKELIFSGFSIRDIKYIFGFSRFQYKYIALIFVFGIFYYLFGAWTRMITYYISFIFPDYIDDLLNQPRSNSFMSLTSAVVRIVSSIFGVFIIQGLIIQKLSIQLGVRRGILITTFSFYLVLLALALASPPNIIDTFINIPTYSLYIILFTILYFKTNTLIVPILTNIFAGLIYTIHIKLDPVSFYLNESYLNNSHVILENYQKLVESQIDQVWFKIVISTLFFIYFIGTNFPKNNTILPYFANRAKAENSALTEE
jgi:hypothetical protein